MVTICRFAAQAKPSPNLNPPGRELFPLIGGEIAP